MFDRMTASAAAVCDLADPAMRGSGGRVLWGIVNVGEQSLDGCQYTSRVTMGDSRADVKPGRPAAAGGKGRLRLVALCELPSIPKRAFMYVNRLAWFSLTKPFSLLITNGFEQNKINGKLKYHFLPLAAQFEVGLPCVQKTNLSLSWLHNTKSTLLQ